MKNKNVFFAIIAIAIVAIASIVIVTAKTNPQPRLVTISEASLKEVIEVGELSTLEYTYNSYTSVSESNKEKKGKDKEEKIKYYVSYKGSVKAGFDFEDLSVNCDNESKIITIVIPEIKINSVNVDETSLDFIFVKEKYDTQETYSEAYKACTEDLIKKANENNSLNEIAKANAISTMEALLAPWEETLPEGYEIEYK